MNYWNNDLTPTGLPTQPTAADCRSYCECAHDAPFFTWGGADQKCYCKSADTSPGGETGKISGVARGCSGASEYIFFKPPLNYLKNSYMEADAMPHSNFCHFSCSQMPGEENDRQTSTIQMNEAQNDPSQNILGEERETVSELLPIN